MNHSQQLELSLGKQIELICTPNIYICIFYSNKFFIPNITIIEIVICYVIYYYSNNTISSALTLLRISSNTTAVAVTLVIFLY